MENEKPELWVISGFHISDLEQRHGSLSHVTQKTATFLFIGGASYGEALRAHVCLTTLVLVHRLHSVD